MTQRRVPRWALWTGLPVLFIVLVISLWRWDWFIPIIQSRASAALQRTVTIGHLHVALGRVVRVTARDVVVANPPDWPQDAPPLVRLPQIGISVDILAYLHGGQLVIPQISLDKPSITLLQRPDGASNYGLQLGGGPSSGPAPRIGDLQIDDGQIAAKLAKLRTDMTIAVSTRGEGSQAQIVATAKGTYGGAPITGQATGGALLSLRDAGSPWPIDLDIANGATRVSLSGTLQDPLHLKGADLKLRFSGSDMGQLQALTGLPIPETPPFRITGNLDFANRHIQFRDLVGQVGKTDLEGSFDVDALSERPVLTADLRSRQVDLTDLAGFIGAQPTTAASPGTTQAERKEAAHAAASPKVLPNTPISVPHLTWADVHLKYHGQHIEGRSMPLDDVTVALDLDDGVIRLHPLSFGVGPGRIIGNLVLTPQKNGLVRVKTDIDLTRVDVARLMSATHVFNGAGTVSGTATLDSTGNSVATLAGNGDGGIRFGMSGGDLSALLVDISGLQFGNALLSALGIPTRTQVSCLVGDLPLKNGVLDLRALVLDTDEGIINGTGSVNLRDETLDLAIRTEAKHFSIGSLPTPINISGTFKDPSIRPGAELAVRGGLAVGLGVLFPPLALLPTIQLGNGDDHRCDRLLNQARAEPNGQRLPAPKAATPAR